MSLADCTANLRAPIVTSVADKPTVKVHSVEWRKVGHGFRVMTVDEWSARWKKNEAWPECLQCGSKNTKEHHFTQTWCRGKKKWDSECLCLDCHSFSYRSYCDPDFKTPEEYEKERWQEMVKSEAPKAVAAS